MRKILFILFALTALLSAQAASNNKLYQYVGNSVTVKNLMDNNSTVHLTRGQVLSVDGNLDSDQRVYIILDGKNAKALIEAKEFGGDNNWDKIFKAVDQKTASQKPAIKVNLVSDSLCIVTNTGNDTITIFMDGRQPKELSANEDVNLYKTSAADSVEFRVAGPFEPQTLYGKFKPQSSSLSMLDIVLIGVISLIILVAIVILIIYKVKNKKQAKDDKEDNDTVNAADFSVKVIEKQISTGPKRGKGKKSRNKTKTVNKIFQKIKFSTVSEEAVQYKQQLQDYYRKNRAYDKEIENKINEGIENLIVELPLIYFQENKPEEAQDWYKIDIEGTKYWVKPLPRYNKTIVTTTAKTAVVNPTAELRELISNLQSLPVITEENNSGKEQQQSDKPAEAKKENVAKGTTSAETKKDEAAKPESQDVKDGKSVNDVEQEKVSDSKPKETEAGKEESVKVPETSEVKKEKAELINVAKKEKIDELVKKLTTIADDIDKLVASASQLGDTERQAIVSKHQKEFKDELAKQKEASNKEIKKLNETISSKEASFKREREQLINKAEEEKKKLKAEGDKLVAETKKKADEEMKEYKSRLVFYVKCQKFANLAVSFFDKVEEIRSLATKFYNDFKETGNDQDSFSYYFARIDNKYEKSIEKISNLSSHVRELRYLASTGLALKGGWIDKMLTGEKDESRVEGLLQLTLYADVMSKYGGIAIIMADELAYQIPAMVQGSQLPEATELAKKSDELKDILKELGYNVVYVKPFTPLSDYTNVKNEQFVNMGLKQGTILEVVTMAVNFGSKNSQTVVHVQE